MNSILGFCIGAGSACIGLIIGKYVTNSYWISCANTGFRASVRGKLYTVKETGDS